MHSFSKAVTSSVGKKILTGLTGLALSIFVLVHLLGNFNLFIGKDAFNGYVHKLDSMGALLYIAEAGLVLIFIIHAMVGISIYLNKKKARPQAYEKVSKAGGKSHKSLASTSMIYTGILLFIFLVFHLKTFKYGPHYTVFMDGVEVRDLYRLVVETYLLPMPVIVYTVIMLLLGLHLRHGFWSAFQSLGVNHPRYSPIIYSIGILFAIVIAVGFLTLPIWIYFTGGAA